MRTAGPSKIGAFIEAASGGGGRAVETVAWARTGPAAAMANTARTAATGARVTPRMCWKSVWSEGCGDLVLHPLAHVGEGVLLLVAAGGAAAIFALELVHEARQQRQ